MVVWLFELGGLYICRECEMHKGKCYINCTVPPSLSAMMDIIYQGESSRQKSSRGLGRHEGIATCPSSPTHSFQRSATFSETCHSVSKLTQVNSSAYRTVFRCFPLRWQHIVMSCPAAQHWAMCHKSTVVSCCCIITLSGFMWSLRSMISLDRYSGLP